MTRMPTITARMYAIDVRINHFFRRKCFNKIHAFADDKMSQKEYSENNLVWYAQESADFGFSGQTLSVKDIILEF